LSTFVPQFSVSNIENLRPVLQVNERLYCIHVIQNYLTLLAWTPKTKINRNPIRINVCINAFGRISVKFDMGDFYENLSRKLKIG